MYKPSEQVLDNYANILINFALNNCQGLKKGEVVLLRVPECAKPMLISLRRAVLKAGGHAIVQFIPDEFDREFYELAEDYQLDFFPEHFVRGQVDQIDHLVAILADTNKKALEGISPSKIMKKQIAYKPYSDWREKKESAGKFTWTLALYGTEAMAQEAKMPLEEYWEQIIQACHLDADDPVQKWKETAAEITRVKQKLDALKIQKLRIEAENTDLTILLGDDRKWLGGTGRNIPSFEVFISPDWRGTEGHIQLTEPLYRYGNLIENVYLEFKEGLVVKATAESGEDVLKQMIATKNADKVGEFSLTDGRFSRITRFMAETLYDENVGGEQGNTHIALGKAYKDSYTGDIPSLTAEDWERFGFNESAVHTDIVATTRRTVTATCKDGSQRVIYKDGQFTI